MNYHPVVVRDRDPISARSAFKRARRLELHYGAQLRKIARHVGDIIGGFDWNTLAASLLAQAHLKRYADTLRPWAEAVANRMVLQVAASDRRSWQQLSANLGRALHREIEQAPTGEAMRASMQRQVGLITSLPIEAAERVHALVQEGISRSRRASEIADDIMQTGAVTRSRATLIATTEVSRTATELTKARAQHVGSEEYIWRTAGDSDVRHDHKILNGKVFRWDSPPIADVRSGARAHPGCIYRCRCYPQVIIPD